MRGVVVLRLRVGSDHPEDPTSVSRVARRESSHGDVVVDTRICGASSRSSPRASGGPPSAGQQRRDRFPSSDRPTFSGCRSRRRRHRMRRRLDQRSAAAVVAGPPNRVAVADQLLLDPGALLRGNRHAAVARAGEHAVHRRGNLRARVAVIALAEVLERELPVPLRRIRLARDDLEILDAALLATSRQFAVRCRSRAARRRSRGEAFDRPNVSCAGRALPV